MNNQPNQNIHCSVNTCRYHTNAHCSLDQIRVGNTNQSAEHAAATECNSFEFAGELHPNMDEVQRLKQKKNNSVGDSMNGGLYGNNSMDANRSQKDF